MRYLIITLRGQYIVIAEDILAAIDKVGDDREIIAVIKLKDNTIESKQMVIDISNIGYGKDIGNEVNA